MHWPRGDRDRLRAAARVTIDRVVDCIVRNFDPDRVIVFGSYARGDVHEGSDLDLLIVKETQERFIDRIGAILAACDSPVALEPLVYTSQELTCMIERGNDFILTALEEGKVVYEKSRSSPRAEQA